MKNPFSVKKPEHEDVVIQKEMARIFASPERGLSGEQAKELMEAGYGNEDKGTRVRTNSEIVRDNVFTFFNLIFIVLGACLITVGEFKNMLFLGIAAINTVIGIFQQIRSRNTLSKLAISAASTTLTVRDGACCDIPSHELVRDDVVELFAGRQIPADAIVLSGTVQVNEALVTGEAEPVTKYTGDELLSGSFVISGRCRARLDKVGADSYATKLEIEAKKNKTSRSEMMRSLDKLIKFIGILLIPIGVALMLNQYYVLKIGFKPAVVSMVAALVGMIPEGLYLLTTVALAIGTIKLARGRTLVQDMDSIEALARVDIICVDKTGTITMPEMAVSGIVLLNSAEYSENAVRNVFNEYCAVIDADNDTAKAMKSYFAMPSTWQAEEVSPFTSQTKWSSVTFKREGTYVLGAPEFVLGSHYGRYDALLAPYMSTGDRVLLLCKYSKAPVQGDLMGTPAPLALVLIGNPVRPDAAQTFDYFMRSGVSIKVISGDNPAAVSAIAVKAGIQDGERYFDASSAKSDGELMRAATEYTVFGRVTPDQKRIIIRALKKAGHTVAMVGDGVNDVLALKDADCSVAMASGSDAATHVAQLVLLDSDFSAMPKVVAEGRRIINNIQRAASLFLVKTIFSFFMSLITLVAAMPYPFVPIQLSLISSLTIGIPGFFLALEPNTERVKGRFMQNVLQRAFPGGATNLLIICMAELFAFAFAFKVAELYTISTLLMLGIGLMVLYKVCIPLDWKRRGICIGMGVCATGAVLIAPEAFSLVSPSLQTGLVYVVLLALSWPVMETVEKQFEKGLAAFEIFKKGRAEKKSQKSGAK